MSLAEIIETVSLVASAIATAVTTSGTVSAAYPVCASTVQCLRHIHYACKVTLLLAQCPYSTQHGLHDVLLMTMQANPQLICLTRTIDCGLMTHQVSAIRDSDEERSIVGLTFRLGRHSPGQLPPLQCPLADMACVPLFLTFSGSQLHIRLMLHCNDKSFH